MVEEMGSGMQYEVWRRHADAPSMRTGDRARAFAHAATLGRDVTVHDEDGNVFGPSGRPAYCPECNRSYGHLPGPPFCLRTR